MFSRSILCITLEWMISSFIWRFCRCLGFFSFYGTKECIILVYLFMFNFSLFHPMNTPWIHKNALATALNIHPTNKKSLTKNWIKQSQIRSEIQIKRKYKNTPTRWPHQKIRRNPCFNENHFICRIPSKSALVHAVPPKKASLSNKRIFGTKK